MSTPLGLKIVGAFYALGAVVYILLGLAIWPLLVLGLLELLASYWIFTESRAGLFLGVILAALFILAGIVTLAANALSMSWPVASPLVVGVVTIIFNAILGGYLIHERDEFD